MLLSSYSSLKIFRECAWKRALSHYFKGIGQNSEALDFGECYHMAIESGLDAGLTELRKKGLSNKEDLLKEMYKRLITFLARHNIQLLEHEVKFEIVFDGYEDNPYTGFIDAIALYNGEVYLVEFKTAAQIECNHVDVDTQLTSYLWACKELEKYNPKGVLWIANKKAVEKQPTILKDGNLSVAKNQNVSVEAYKKKAQEIYGQEIPPKVEDFIKWLEQNDTPYILMAVSRRTDKQLESYGNLVSKMIVEETKLLRDIKENGIMSVKDDCCAFPTQICGRSCGMREVCFHILRTQEITEDEVSSLRDVLKEQQEEADVQQG